MAIFGKTLMLFGLLVFGLSVAWWYFYFVQFHGVDVKQASDCFYYFEPSCEPTVVEELLSASDVPPYSPYAFWASVILFGLGGTLLALSPFRR